MATVLRGAATRTRIVEATARLLLDHDDTGAGTGTGAGPTVAAIARAAGVFPNQVTHHFGSKDRLLVDAAFTLFLRDTARLQLAGRRAMTAANFRAVLARTVLLMPSVALVVATIAPTTRADTDAGRRAQQLLAVVFRQSERYLDRMCADHGWRSRVGTDRDTRTFWSAAFGAVLLARVGVPGGPSDVDLAATITIEDPGPAPEGPAPEPGAYRSADRGAP